MTYTLVRKALLFGLIAILTGAITLAAAGCGDTPTVTPNPGTHTTTVNCQNVGTPSISILPTHGKAGTQVTVVGGNFPPGCTVQIRLGTQENGTTSEVYATTEAAQHGTIQATFTMPDRWPNGELITFPEVLIVAATPDFVEKAVTPFKYEAFVTPPATPTSAGQTSNFDCPTSDCNRIAQPITKPHINPYLQQGSSDITN